MNDVSRAFFEAPTKTNICIELPEEERIEGQDDVGILDYSLPTEPEMLQRTFRPR